MHIRLKITCPRYSSGKVGVCSQKKATIFISFILHKKKQEKLTDMGTVRGFLNIVLSIKEIMQRIIQ